MIGIAAHIFLDRINHINLILVDKEKEREKEMNELVTLLLTGGQDVMPFKDSCFPRRKKDWESHTRKRGRKKRR
jgi:hypothetical protein